MITTPTSNDASNSGGLGAGITTFGGYGYNGGGIIPVQTIDGYRDMLFAQTGPQSYLVNEQTQAPPPNLEVGDFHLSATAPINSPDAGQNDWSGLLDRAATEAGPTANVTLQTANTQAAQQEDQEEEQYDNDWEAEGGEITPPAPAPPSDTGVQPQNDGQAAAAAAAAQKAKTIMAALGNDLKSIDPMAVAKLRDQGLATIQSFNMGKQAKAVVSVPQPDGSVQTFTLNLVVPWFTAAHYEVESVTSQAPQAIAAELAQMERDRHQFVMNVQNGISTIEGGIVTLPFGGGASVVAKAATVVSRGIAATHIITGEVNVLNNSSYDTPLTAIGTEIGVASGAGSRNGQEPRRIRRGRHNVSRGILRRHPRRDGTVHAEVAQ